VDHYRLTERRGAWGLSLTGVVPQGLKGEGKGKKSIVQSLRKSRGKTLIRKALKRNEREQDRKQIVAISLQAESRLGKKDVKERSKRSVREDRFRLQNEMGGSHTPILRWTDTCRGEASIRGNFSVLRNLSTKRGYRGEGVKEIRGASIGRHSRSPTGVSKGKHRRRGGYSQARGGKKARG